MSKKNIFSNIIKISLCIIIPALSGLAFYAMALQTDVSSCITSLFQLNSVINPVVLVLIGMLFLAFYLGLTYIFTPNKSPDSLFHWLLIFFAFTTIPDIIQTVQLVKAIETYEAGVFFAIQFDLLNNLSILSEFPKDLLLFIILLFCFTRIEHFHIKKKEIALLALSLLLCIAMLVLPGIYHLIMFVAVYCLIILAHCLFTEFSKQLDKRYEKVISVCILALLTCRCIYRALILINSYLL